MVKKLDIIDTSEWLTPKEVASLLKYKKSREVLTAIARGESDEVLNRAPAGEKPSWLISPASVAAFQRRRISVGKKREQAPPETKYPAGVEKW
jgi:hypothetical protein